MKIKHKGILMFVLLAKKDGNFIAFHRNTYDEVKDFAKRFESEPAGHIMHWLLRRGIEADDIYNLLRVCFTEEEAAGALETKMEDGRVVSQRSLERAKQVMAFDMQNPDVDITQAMRASEIVEYKARQEAIKKNTSFETLDFNSDMALFWFIFVLIFVLSRYHWTFYYYLFSLS